MATSIAWAPELVLGALALWSVLAAGFGSFAGDPGVFYKYATAVGHGQLPYRDFAFEYPPLDMIPMILPYALAGGPPIEIYRFLLFVENVALLVAIGSGVWWLARRGAAHETPLRAVVMYGLGAFALEPVITWRVDATVTALTVIALMATVGRRPIAAGLALGAGVMTKAYPLAMLPVLMLGQISIRRWLPALRLLAAFAMTIFVLSLPLVFVAGTSSLYFVRYLVERGTQIESLQGAVALLASAAGGTTADISVAYGTVQVQSPLVPLLGLVGTVMTVAGVTVLGLAIWHRFRADRHAFGQMQLSSQAAYLSATGLLVLVTSRILSPQYIFWIVPFAALIPRRQALLLVVICLLTTLVYSFNYQQLIGVEAFPVLLVNFRNVLLLALFVWLIWPDLWASIRGLAHRPTHSSPAGC